MKESQPGHSDRGDGGALTYLIQTPEGSVFYQDTSGYYSGTIPALKPDVAMLAAAGRGNIDGEPIQGSLALFVAGRVEGFQAFPFHPILTPLTPPLRRAIRP